MNPYQADSLHAQAAFERAVAAAAQGDEALAVTEYLKASKIAETAREWYLAAVACHRVGDFLQRARPPVDLERAFRMSRRAIAAYEQCGSWPKPGVSPMRSCGCTCAGPACCASRCSGASTSPCPGPPPASGCVPLRVIGTALTLVLLYGLAYRAIAGVVAVHAPEPLTLWHTIYFSRITFATWAMGTFSRHLTRACWRKRKAW